LASTRAVPGRLQAAGFTWRQPELERALRHVLGR
jgi:NAD dependent epimerase/dehydratase family enzyme